MRHDRRFARTTTLVRAGLGATLIVAALTGCSKPVNTPDASTREVTFTTSDGYSIAATLYLSNRPDPAGLILVPMLGTTRDRWSSFARAAQAEGYMSLAIDMRGHGESTTRKGEKRSYKSFTTEDWLGVRHDIAGAKAEIVDAGADPENIAIVGASIGANLALRYAMTDPQIQAVAMVSPGRDYHGVTVEDAIAQLSDRPVLLMDAIGDSYSSETCNALQEIAKGHCELHEYSGAAHGTDMLDTNENAPGQILQWLSAIVGPGAAKANE